eukprot:10176064-Heterocapsa_arctica.AAC.1
MDISVAAAQPTDLYHIFERSGCTFLEFVEACMHCAIDDRLQCRMLHCAAYRPLPDLREQEGTHRQQVAVAGYEGRVGVHPEARPVERPDCGRRQPEG